MISNGKEIQTLGVLILCVSKWLMAISVISGVRQEPIAVAHYLPRLAEIGTTKGENAAVIYDRIFRRNLTVNWGGLKPKRRCLIRRPLSSFFYPVATKIPKPLHSKLGGFTEDVYTRATYKDQFKKAIIQRPTVRGIIVASQVKIAFSYAKEDSGMGPNHTIPNMTATNALEDSGDISKDFFPRDSMETLELSDYSRI